MGDSGGGDWGEGIGGRGGEGRYGVWVVILGRLRLV